VERVVEVRDPLVAAIDGERVLGQVVRPDAEEVALRRQHVGDDRRRGDLDHHAHGQLGVERDTLVAELLLHLRHERLRLAELFDAGDHREEEPHVSADTRPQDGAQLRAEGARVLQGQPD
jgi:hypothetical protein